MLDTNNRNEDKHKNRWTNNGTDNKGTKKNIGEIKLLVTKWKAITEEEDNQDNVIEMLRNIQDIVEYWIQNNQIKGVKDMIEKNKILKDVHCYSNWLSKPKVTGNRVSKVEIYFIIITSVQVRELIQI